MIPTDRALRQYIAGALDPPRWEEVRDALQASPALRRRLAGLLAATVEIPVRAWVLPPPGAQAPFVLTGGATSATIMDGAQPDGWLELALMVPSELERHVVVVLERRRGAWDVIFPSGPDDAVHAAALPQDDQGRRRLDVTLGEDGERVGVVLIPEAPAWGGDDPFAPIRAQMAAGDLPVVTFDIRR